MAEIKWIKITTDIFDDEKIKIIDTMPDRDAVIVIWFKLLALTGKKNNSGLLFMSARMPYTEEMLATIFNRPINTVRMALKLFEDFEMIEVADNKVISVINWEKHQNIDGMDKIKEQSKLRSQKYRDKQKLLADNNGTSRDGHATDKDKEKEEDKNKINKKKENKPPMEDQIKNLELSEPLKEILIKWYIYKKTVKNTNHKLVSYFFNFSKKIGTEYKSEKHLIDSIKESMDQEYTGVFPTKSFNTKNNRTEEETQFTQYEEYFPEV